MPSSRLATLPAMEVPARSLVLVLLLTGLSGAAACGERESESTRATQEEASVTGLSIEEAQRQLTDSVMALPGVVGIGIGECEGVPCIKVFAVQITAELVQRIPKSYKGYTVKIEQTGEFRALQDSAG